jgi:hypothetical protein
LIGLELLERLKTKITSYFQLEEKKFEEFAKLVARAKRVKHVHEQSPYPEEDKSICGNRSMKLEKENGLTPISTKPQSKSRPRKKLADIGNFKKAKDESNQSLLKFTKRPKKPTLDNVQLDESDSDEKTFPKWCQNYKRPAKYQAFACIDLCGTLFFGASTPDYDRVFLK